MCVYIYMYLHKQKEDNKEPAEGEGERGRERKTEHVSRTFASFVERVAMRILILQPLDMTEPTSSTRPETA